MYNRTKDSIIYILECLSKWEKEFKWFIPPACYTILKTYAKSKDIDLDNLNFEKKVKLFLDEINFFDDSNFNIKAKNILPISTIHTQDWNDIDEITNNFWELLKCFLWNKEKKLVSNMTNMLWELLNNVAHHSGETDKNGYNSLSMINYNFHSWQFFYKENFIQIAIVDAWIWILSSVRKKIPKIQETSEAIKKALEANFTWWSILNKNWISNAGIWLTVTFDTIKKLWWDMFIWTKDCLFSYNWDSKKSLFEKIPNWKGTFVILNIYTNKETNVNFYDIKNNYLKNWNNVDLNINFW